MPKEYPRAARLSAQLQEELSDLLHGNVLRDPRVYGVDFTVTAIDLTPDLSHAHVRVSSLVDAARLDEAVQGLNHASGRLRGQLGRRLRLRHIPELSFKADQVLREVEKINRLLRDARTEDRKHALGRGEEAE